MNVMYLRIYNIYNRNYSYCIMNIRKYILFILSLLLDNMQNKFSTILLVKHLTLLVYHIFNDKEKMNFVKSVNIIA